MMSGEDDERSAPRGSTLMGVYFVPLTCWWDPPPAVGEGFSCTTQVNESKWQRLTFQISCKYIFFIGKF